ncbi:IclR family transcriptional regulator [Halobellus ruber]|uniref:IclR family transcriptional regulator n=1 Tax=Halobellus ruber TaxID=2761102 RepID=A0A7J9SIF3_9EURY|nr:IclR family transcriptional regulator [Halobellus ruber]MBB6646740.1 IclR family transcriptional regulator [Halobellus ruber]
MTPDSVPLQTVARAFEVLELLEREGEAGPARIATLMDVTRSTAHDYLVSLASTGFVVKDEGKYRIGYRFLERGSRLKHRSRFFNSADIVVRKLSADSGELAQLGCAESADWVMLHESGDVTSVQTRTYPGFRTPIHSHAAGKVLLANFPAERIDELLDVDELEAVTEHTITDPDALRPELETIREQGHAVDHEEQVIGIGFVACPVLEDGELLGSVSVACPTGRLRQDSYREDLIKTVQAAAEEISVNYRYH